MQTQCRPCTNAPNTSLTGASYYPRTNGQLDSPLGCNWECVVPYKIYSGQCIRCNTTNPYDASKPCVNPGLTVNSSAGPGVRVTLGGVAYRLIRFNASGTIQFDQDVTIDLLLLGGGGAGGGVYSTVGAGGGGGAGRVVLRYGYKANQGVTVQVLVGEGGSSDPVDGYSAYSSQVQYTWPNGLSALRGGGGGTAGLSGFSGASSGGAGSSTGLAGLAYFGYRGGTDSTRGSMGGGGGGSAWIGGNSLACQGGAGGPGRWLLSNQSSTLFDPDARFLVAGGGGGGSSIGGCQGGPGSAGGGDGSPGGGDLPGMDAAPNSGSGGGGASSTSGTVDLAGGRGGSGLVVLRYVEDECVCA